MPCSYNMSCLQERIYREHLLTSQFAPGKMVFQSNFPERNRLMAAISDATVIVEASDTSGSLHQAAECVHLGRWLFIAKSLAENPSFRWPKDFAQYPSSRSREQPKLPACLHPCRHAESFVSPSA